MTQVTLINPNSDFLLDSTHVPPLGLLTVASILKSEGIEVNLVDLAENPDVDLISRASEIVGVTGTTAHFGELRNISEILSDRKLVAGGPHANVRPDSLVELGYEIGGIHPKDIIKKFTGKIVPDDVNKKYFSPDRSLINRSAYNGPATVIVSRGCPYSCGFCAKPSDDKYHRFGIDDVKKEIMQLYNEGEKRLIFRDDFFAANPRWVTDVCEYMGSLSDLEWTCITRSDTLTEDLFRKMRDSGMTGIAIGVESGSQKILDGIDKKIKVSQNTKVRELCSKYDVRFKAYIVYGLPGESMDTLNETHKWLEDNKPDAIGLYMFMPLPGSPIFENKGHFDIEFPVIPYEKMYYAGNPDKIKCIVSTSNLSADQITSFYQKTIGDFGLGNKNKFLL